MMGYVTYQSAGVLNEFIDSVKDDPTTEILPTTSEWEAFRYRRADVVDGRDMGTFDYGIVYRNKKVRLIFTGIADDDFRTWEGLRQ